ncbi:MAG TPA: hypothetical protein VF628_08450 [Allosphingosinicella sp.]|jgi:hypothetical protein
MRGWAFGLLIGLACAQPVAAQRGLRSLDVPATAPWQHAASGMVLPAEILGSRRVSIGDSGTEELDVVTQYEGEAGLTTTIYLFRSQIPVVPLWFDRGQTVLEALRMAGSEASAPVAGTSFALPGQSVASAMRVTYPFTSGGYKSTGLALTSVNGWLVKVRMSSKSLEPLALDSRLAAFVGAMRWPAAAKPAVAADAIQPCGDKLSFRQAKMVKPDMAQGLLGSLLAMAGSAKGPDPSVRYCRESSEGVIYGVYRRVGTKDGYVMAIADSGRLLSIGSSPSIDPKAKPNYSVALLDLGQTATYPSFDRLPAPKQALQLISSQRPLSSTKVGSTTINISTPD